MWLDFQFFSALWASKWFTAISHTVHNEQADGKQHYTAISHTVYNWQAGATQLFCIQVANIGKKIS